MLIKKYPRKEDNCAADPRWSKVTNFCKAGRFGKAADLQYKIQKDYGLMKRAKGEPKN